MTKISQNLNVQNLITRHMRLWEAQQEYRQEAATPSTGRQAQAQGFYISFSRDYGSGGLEISKRVAEKLGWQHFDHEVVEAIASEAKTREDIVALFDESVRSELQTYVQNLFTLQTWDGTHYIFHLVHVLSAIARHGNAVIVGHGANFVLPPQHGLRVRVVAPTPVCAHNYVQLRGVTEAEALREITRRNSEYAAFIRHHFHRDIADPLAYDVILNAEHLDLDAAVEMIIRAAEIKLKTALPPGKKVIA
ncbi:cytidylate kinase-like family protein [candidate division KSB1 bacterium]|nr:cytidylate kinase-like family protein [candidate division KSB1 bacterium]